RNEDGSGRPRPSRRRAAGRRGRRGGAGEQPCGRMASWKAPVRRRGLGRRLAERADEASVERDSQARRGGNVPSPSRGRPPHGRPPWPRSSVVFLSGSPPRAPRPKKPKGPSSITRRAFGIVRVRGPSLAGRPPGHTRGPRAHATTTGAEKRAVGAADAETHDRKQDSVPIAGCQTGDGVRRSASGPCLPRWAKMAVTAPLASTTARMSATARVAVVAGCRTPFAKAGRVYRDLTALDLAKACVRELVERTEIAPDSIGTVVMGQVIPSVKAPNLGREVVLGTG